MKIETATKRILEQMADDLEKEHIRQKYIQQGETFLLAQDGVFLGKVTQVSGIDDPESLINPRSPYRDPAHEHSVFNPLSPYAGKEGIYSLNNPHCIYPPKFYQKGVLKCYISKNDDLDAPVLKTEIFFRLLQTTPEILMDGDLFGSGQYEKLRVPSKIR